MQVFLLHDEWLSNMALYSKVGFFFATFDASYLKIRLVARFGPTTFWHRWMRRKLQLVISEFAPPRAELYVMSRCEVKLLNHVNVIIKSGWAFCTALVRPFNHRSPDVKGKVTHVRVPWDVASGWWQNQPRHVILKLQIVHWFLMAVLEISGKYYVYSALLNW